MAEEQAVRVGLQLLELARARGAGSLLVVGTGKNVGKTVAMRAIYEAACDSGLRVGVASAGLDGEAVDQIETHPKPRLWLRAGTILATAAGALPRSPASEILGVSRLRSAVGRLVYARAAGTGFYELIGPSTASGLREVLDELSALSEFVIIDGAIDRLAALAGGHDAIVVAGGAATAKTVQEAADEIRALVQRLGVARFDPDDAVVRVQGALTVTQIGRLIALREQRQIVVRDPTQIALRGKALSQAFVKLRIRCERPLHVMATTIASIGPEWSLEPRTLVRAVAAATGLPTFDVYAGARAP
jgi:hypothetical protein